MIFQATAAADCRQSEYAGSVRRLLRIAWLILRELGGAQCSARGLGPSLQPLSLSQPARGAYVGSASDGRSSRSGWSPEADARTGPIWPAR